MQRAEESSPRTSKSAAQQSQQELVGAAHKLPGVAEAIEAYNAAARYVPVFGYRGSPGVVYGTGGNPR